MYITHIFLITWFCRISAGTTVEFKINNQGITDVTEYPIPNGTTKWNFFGNSISVIPPGYFATTPTITVIYLGMNSLLVIEKHTFAGLPDLSDLRLNDNKIHTIHPESFKENMALKLLQLNDNRLQTLPETMFDITDHPNALNSFFIYNNLLVCDDSLSWLKQASGDWLVLTNPQYIVCAGPEQLEGCKWNDLAANDFEPGTKFCCFISPADMVRIFTNGGPKIVY